MKKILLTIVLILFVSSTTYSQFRMKVGPNLGMNFNIGTGSDLNQSLTGLGMVIGAQVDMNFTPTIGLITNLHFYDNRSASTNDIITYQGVQGVSLNSSFSLAYFMIEPLFKLSLQRSKIYLNFGPVIGFSIESSLSQKLTKDNYDPLTEKTTLKNMLVRFGLKAGAGYDISLSRLLDLTPQFNFEFGITNVQSNVSARILTFQVLVAAKFRVL